MPWYFLFSPYSTRSQTKQLCSINFIVAFHGTWGHVQFEKRSRKPGQAWSVEMTSNKSDKINTQDWSWNITVGTVGLLSIMRQVLIFILKCIVYAAFCGLIWLLQGWRSRKLVDDTAWTTQIWRVRFVRKDEMSYYWWNEWPDLY